MTLTLTPEMLAGAYNYLRLTPPFVKMKIPPPQVVKFAVGRSRRDFGAYQRDGERHIVTMSANLVGQTMTLMRYMAHEMIHLHLEVTGTESRKGGRDTHNAAFKKYAAQVCKYHGFDPKAFY